MEDAELEKCLECDEPRCTALYCDSCSKIHRGRPLKNKTVIRCSVCVREGLSGIGHNIRTHHRRVQLKKALEKMTMENSAQT